MMMKLVDKLVREGNYAGALGALAKAREQEPKNPYVLAYEERVRTLISLQARSPLAQGASVVTGSATFRAFPASPPESSDLPSVEGQINAIATSVLRMESSPRKKQEDDHAKSHNQGRVAILGRIAKHLERANENLAQHNYKQALEEISRARLLDPDNKDIAALEKRIRKAQEDALEREDEERLRNAAAEERRREEQLRTELARLQQEQVEKRSKEEEIRRVVQKEKVQYLLQQARTLLAAGRFNEARSELSFALVLEPLNEEAAIIGKQIAQKEEEARQAQVELRKREEEERRKKEVALRAEIQRQIEFARASAAQGDFTEALRTITRAYMLDPTSEQLQACENDVLAAQEESRRRLEEEQRAKAKAIRERAEEEERLHARAERESILEAERCQAEEGRKADEQQIFRHLSEAKEHLEAGRFDEALAQVGAAFLIDPFDEKVKQLEQQVLLAQHRKRQEEPLEQLAEEVTGPDQETVKKIAAYLAEANHFCRKSDLPAAFEEIAKAFALDPLNPTIQDCEVRIWAEFIRHEAKKKELESHNAPGTTATPSVIPSATTAPPATLPPAASREDAEKGGASIADAAQHRRRRLVSFAGLAVAFVAVGMYLAIPANGPDTVPEPHAKAAALDGPLNPSPEGPAVQKPATHVSDSHQTDVVNPANKGGQTGVTLAKIPTTPRAKHADITSPRGFSDAGNPDPEVPPPTKLAGTTASSRGETDAAAPPPVVTQRKDPEIVRLEHPQLSDAALQSRADEQVTVTVQISPEGKPLQASIVKSSNPLFNDAVIEAVMGSAYSPGIGSSGPITTWMTIPFKFKQ